MDVERLLRVRAQRLHYGRADGDIGHEMPVHDVDIHQADGMGECAMRLIAAPVLNEVDDVIGLHGVKQLLPKGAVASQRLDPTIFVML